MQAGGMMGMITAMGGWGWILLGLALMALEMLAPGLFFIWLGLAAILTGVLAAALGLSWQMASLAFAALSLATVLAGRRLTARRGDVPDPAHDLNIRGARLVGRSFRLDRPLMNGEGQLKIGDSVWRITGPDMVTGAQVRVAAIEGATLVVESA
jgi:inner membrane protein